LIASVLLVLAVKRSHESSAAKDATQRAEVLLDFGDEATRRSILSFVSTGGRLWSNALVNECAHGTDERYRLTAEGLQAEPLLVELVVQAGNATVLMEAPRWIDYTGHIYVTPTAGYILPPPPPPELTHLQEKPRAAEHPRTYATTSEQLTEARRQYSALIASRAPVVTKQFGIDGSTWVIESCIAGRYNYFARWSPDSRAVENQQLISFAAYLLELAHRPVKFVD
jgi:hypothetical protein